MEGSYVHVNTSTKLHDEGTHCDYIGIIVLKMTKFAS